MQIISQRSCLHATCALLLKCTAQIEVDNIDGQIEENSELYPTRPVQFCFYGFHLPRKGGGRVGCVEVDGWRWFVISFADHSARSLRTPGIEPSIRYLLCLQPDAPPTELCSDTILINVLQTQSYYIYTRADEGGGGEHLDGEGWSSESIRIMLSSVYTYAS